MMSKMLLGMARKLRDAVEKKFAYPEDGPKRPGLSDETAAKVLAIHIEEATYGRRR